MTTNAAASDSSPFWALALLFTTIHSLDGIKFMSDWKGLIPRQRSQAPRDVFRRNSSAILLAGSAQQHRDNPPASFTCQPTNRGFLFLAGNAPQRLPSSFTFSLHCWLNDGDWGQLKFVKINLREDLVDVFLADLLTSLPQVNNET